MDFQRLKLKHDKLLSDFALKCKVRHYSSDLAAWMSHYGEVASVVYTKNIGHGPAHSYTLFISSPQLYAVQNLQNPL